LRYARGHAGRTDKMHCSQYFTSFQRQPKITKDIAFQSTSTLLAHPVGQEKCSSRTRIRPIGTIQSAWSPHIILGEMCSQFGGLDSVPPNWEHISTRIMWGKEGSVGEEGCAGIGSSETAPAKRLYIWHYIVHISACRESFSAIFCNLKTTSGSLILLPVWCRRLEMRWKSACCQRL